MITLITVTVVGELAGLRTQLRKDQGRLSLTLTKELAGVFPSWTAASDLIRIQLLHLICNQLDPMSLKLRLGQGKKKLKVVSMKLVFKELFKGTIILSEIYMFARLKLNFAQMNIKQ
ncbi:hypothetical protein NDU88_012445 [Pleurodeles waltl]|uniref:Uncharacterized protein n=1 Tax=Pleurodeles waltl TaxID=8319 RepID=A0AAV7R4M7_PLEWA|nr:hypothetical protein NDU88_012445 [Pleurodeles waltl]